MADKNRYITLNNGVKMPLIGYGTFSAEEEKDLKECIVTAVVDVGYRHIDTASLYGNEEIIGEALEECFEKGIKREDLFITTKCWRDKFHDVEGELKESLRKLKLDYVDLYLVHWMVADVDWENAIVKGPPMHEVWKSYEDLQTQGLTKSIGISNCNAMLFIDLLAYAKVKPVVNQIETNPYLQQSKLVELTRKFGCETTAYSPLGSAKWTGNDLCKDEVIVSLAEKYNATPAQISLAWNLNRGVVVIPKSTNPERMKLNFDALDIQLSEEDIEAINKIDKNLRYFDPGNWDYPQYGWKYSPIFN